VEFHRNMKTFRLSILVLVIVSVAIDASKAGCIKPGTNYPGGDIGLGVVKNSKEECQKYCQDTSECLYFTWVDDTHAAPSLQKKCFLKNLMIAKGKKKEGFFAGPKFCRGDSTNISTFEKGALDVHNSLRAKHGSDPLILDKQLSAKAEYWAKQLLAGKVPKDKKYPHSYSGTGENVWSGTGFKCNDDSGKGATRSWYSEIENVDFEKMKPKAPGKKTGHFTQVVWKATTHFGIGYATNEKACFIVAQYLPPGNVFGIKNYRNNVKKPLQ